MMSYNGGLADVTSTRTDENRCTLKVGNLRVLDLVGKGANMVIECKGSKRDPVRADPQAVLNMIAEMIDRLTA